MSTFDESITRLACRHFASKNAGGGRDKKGRFIRMVGGVPQFTWLQIGADILLTRNVFVGGGICNGSRGIIVDFGWKFGAPVDGVMTSPDVVLVKVKAAAVGIDSFMKCEAGWKIIGITPIVGNGMNDKFVQVGK